MKNGKKKIRVNIIDFLSFKFSKLYLIAEAPIITLHVVVLNVMWKKYLT